MYIVVSESELSYCYRIVVFVFVAVAVFILWEDKSMKSSSFVEQQDDDLLADSHKILSPSKNQLHYIASSKILLETESGVENDEKGILRYNSAVDIHNRGVPKCDLKDKQMKHPTGFESVLE